MPTEFVTFLRPLISFKFIFFRKNDSGIPSQCQDVLSGLICVQTVCKDYQQKILVDKELSLWWFRNSWPT